ncbi:MAG: CDP-alcohol phosphatidyltransferase family protein [Chthoniobacterales bacterium]
MRHQCIILADQPSAELCGISLLERLLRQLQRLGLAKAIVLSSAPEVFAHDLANPSPHRSRVAVEIRGRASGPVTARQIVEAWPNDARSVIVIRGEAVFDSRLLELLDAQDSTAVLVDSAPPENLRSLVVSAPTTSRGRLCGAVLLARDWSSNQVASLDAALRQDVEAGRIEAFDIASRVWYSRELRRDLRPYWFRSPAAAQRAAAASVLLTAAQKGAQDFPALVHAPIENFLVSHLCKTAITPNQLTVFSNVVAWGATLLFATGQLAAGTALALAVGILDGLDGKQARIKVETSKTGKLEHWFDALFEISWWIALAYYFRNSGRLPAAWSYLALLLSAEAAAGLAKLSVIRRCGRLIDEMGGFDRIVRLFAGRRNIYVWLFALGVLFQVPAVAFTIIAWWAAATAAFQVPRAIFLVRVFGGKGLRETSVEA